MAEVPVLMLFSHIVKCGVRMMLCAGMLGALGASVVFWITTRMYHRECRIRRRQAV